MKKKNWFRALSLADDKYIAEAHPRNKIKSKRNKAFISIAAACASFALIFCSLWLFVPFNTDPPDVSKYADSDYYEVINRLNILTFQKPRYKNNAEKLWDQLSSISFGVKGDSAENGILVEAPTANGTYQEITDNQVEGIIEADRIKRSDTHIYYLNNDSLCIYSIDKERTKLISDYYLGVKNNHTDGTEFYLSSDCKTVTIITEESLTATRGRTVKLISLDVSDPANIVEK